SGHGHNYQVEPAVRITPGAAFDLATLERLTGEAVIDPFDHTHLNEDTPDFNTQSGVNPSVENIAKVFFDRLAPKLTAAGAELATITVWETDRTSATYPA
ncbi:MAG: 6-carboxytetrahydropterin synthase, partial [Planctomycetota bacterium]